MLFAPLVRLPHRGTAFFGRDMLFEVDEAAKGIDVIAQFPSEPLRLSGYVEKDEVVRVRITALALPHGRTALFGFRFHNRGSEQACSPRGLMADGVRRSAIGG